MAASITGGISQVDQLITSTWTLAAVADADAAIPFTNLSGARLDQTGGNALRFYNDATSLTAGLVYSAYTTLSPALDVSGALQALVLHYRNQTEYASTQMALSSDGFRFYLFSGGVLTNWARYDTAGFEGLNWEPAIAGASATPVATGGTFDATNVTAVGIGWKSKNSGTYLMQFSLSQLVHIDGPVQWGDTNADATTVADFVAELAPTSGNTYHCDLVRQAGPTYEIGMPFDITARNFSDSVIGLAFLDNGKSFTSTNVDAGFWAARLTPPTSGTISFTNLTVATNSNDFEFTVDASLGSASITNSLIVNARSTSLTGANLTASGLNVSSPTDTTIANGDLDVTITGVTNAIQWTADLVAGSTIATDSDIDITFAETDLSDINIPITASNTVTVSPTTGSGTYNLSGLTTAGTVTLDNATANNTTDTIEAGVTYAVASPTAGGGSIDVVVLGQIEVTNGAVYTADASDRFIVDTNAVTSFTIDGFIPGAIEHIGTGSSTILGINNAKLTTTTIVATGGTLNLGDGLNPSANWSVDDVNEVITLSSTETDLLGLRGLACVDYALAGQVYNFETTYRIVVPAGATLTITPVTENIVIDRPIAIAGGTQEDGHFHLDGGTVTIQDSLNLYGETVFKNNLAISFTGTGGTPWTSPVAANLHLQSGTFVMNGGRIVCPGGVRWQNTLTLFQMRGQVWDGNRNGAGESVWFCTAALDKFDVIGWKLIGGKFEFSGGNFNAVNFSEVEYENADKGLSTAGGAPSGVNDFWEIFNFQGSDMQQDFSVWQERKARFINSPPAVIGVNQLNNTSSRGIVEEEFRLRLNFIDSTETPIQGVAFYRADDNNGSRVDYLSQDYVNDRVYSGTSDASGNIDLDFLINVTVIDTNRGSYGGQPKDLRFNSGVVTGNAIAYGYEIGQVSYDTTVYEGIESRITVVEPMLDDINITESTKATVDAYTELNTAAQVYDRAVSYLAGNFLGEGAFLVDRVGLQVSLASNNLVIDGTAGSAFAYASPNVTINSSTFTGGATATTGTVTVTNGALLDGGTFDCDVVYSSGASTTIANVTCNQAFDFTIAGTYTIDGCTFNEVTNSSGGAVILTMLNGSSITTNTGPNITPNNAVTLEVTAVDQSGSPVSGARVYIEAGAGGPTAQGTVLMNELTDVNGLASTTYNYVSSQPMQNGTVRKTSASPYLYPSPIVGSIGVAGLDLTVILNSDE